VRLLYGREPVAWVLHLAASCSGCLLDASTRVVVLGVGTNLPGDPRKQNGSGRRGAQRGGIWLERCRPGAIRLRPGQNAARRGRDSVPTAPAGGRAATRGGLPPLAIPLGAGLQFAVYLRDDGSPGPWCPSEAKLRRTRNYVRDRPDAPRSPPRSSRSSLRSAGTPRRCSRCPAQRRERLCR
jgi:hypothetical protein